MLVINQIQTVLGLRLYCAWIDETIVPGWHGSDRQRRFEIVLICIQNLSYSFKVKTDEHSFQARRWSWACNTIYTKPWRIYVSSQTKIFWSVVLLPFWNPHWCLVKMYTIIQMKALWCESYGFERSNSVLTIHPKSMARLVEASASVRWLLWTTIMPHSMQRLPSELPRWSKKWYR